MRSKTLKALKDWVEVMSNQAIYNCGNDRSAEAIRFFRRKFLKECSKEPGIKITRATLRRYAGTRSKQSSAYPDKKAPVSPARKR